MLDLGDVVTLESNITDSADAPANATAVTCTITLPDGTTETPSVTNVETGLYRATYLTVQAGRHLVNWLATGTNAGAQADVFDVSPASIVSIVSLADAKKQLNIGASTTDHDDELRSYIEAATQVVESYVGAVVRRTVTQTASVHGSALVLHTYPVLSVTSVTEDGSTLDADGYNVNLDTAIVTRVSGDYPKRWSAGVNNVTVTYVVGRPIIPANHTLAAKIIIQHLWETQRGTSGTAMYGGSSSFARQSGSDDVVLQVGWAYAIPRRAVELLERDVQPGGIA